jgi:DNA-binding response OmpR family regulator
LPAQFVVVHDDAKVLETIASGLREAGCHVRATASPMTALDWIEGDAPEALVTRVDFGAGQLNGIALARMARHRHPSLAVVFVPRRDWGQLTACVEEVLPLPIDPAVLVDLVQRLIGGRTPG